MCGSPPPSTPPLGWVSAAASRVREKSPLEGPSIDSERRGCLGLPCQSQERRFCRLLPVRVGLLAPASPCTGVRACHLGQLALLARGPLPLVLPGFHSGIASCDNSIMAQKASRCDWKPETLCPASSRVQCRPVRAVLGPTAAWVGTPPSPRSGLAAAPGRLVTQWPW